MDILFVFAVSDIDEGLPKETQNSCVPTDELPAPYSAVNACEKEEVLNYSSEHNYAPNNDIKMGNNLTLNDIEVSQNEETEEEEFIPSTPPKKRNIDYLL